MLSPLKIVAVCSLALLLFVILPFCQQSLVWSQETEKQKREDLISAAREIIEDARHCALVTLDSSGNPQARMTDPFTPEDNMEIWLGTNPESRKVREILADARVTLYYADPQGTGYVTISGMARLVDDPDEKNQRWKDGWEMFYPDREDSYLLIAITPQKLELLSFRHGITGDSVSWRTPSIQFSTDETRD